MSEWKEYIFKDLFEIPLKNGLNKPSKVRGDGFRMINMKEIFGYNFIGDDTPMELVPLEEREKLFLHFGDLLFARQSLVASGAGKVSYFRGFLPTVFESHLIRCRINPYLSNSLFLYYLIKSPYGRGKIETIVEQTAAAGIRGSDLKELKFKIPDLSTQIAIAEILSSLDDKIELNNKINQELENLAQTLFKQWFIDFEFPNENGEPYKSSGGEMVDSELGEIPKGWGVKPIGDLFEMVVGGDWGMDFQDDEHTELNYVIRGTDIPTLIKGSINSIPFRAIKPSKLKSRQLQINDIIIEISGGSKDQPTGRTVLITKEILERLTNNAVPASFCRLIRPKRNFAEFLGIYLTKIYSEGKTWEYQNQSTGISNFQFKYFESSELLALSDDISVIIKFNDLISGVYSLMTTNENLSLSKIRDTLLPKLISGELEINELSN